VVISVLSTVCPWVSNISERFLCGKMVVPYRVMCRLRRYSFP